MTDMERLKFNLQETNFPYFSEEDLDGLLKMYPNINQASYEGCMLKSSDDSVSLGPISTPNNSAYWVRLAKKYFKAWQQDIKNQRIAAGGGNFTMLRSDEQC